MALTLAPPPRPDRQSKRRASERLANKIRIQIADQPGEKPRRAQSQPVVARFGALLTLLPPGTRKANRFWVVRGWLRDGRRVEISSRTTDKKYALLFARELAAGYNAGEAHDRIAGGATSARGARARRGRVVAIEIARSPAEAALIEKWLRPRDPQ